MVKQNPLIFLQKDFNSLQKYLENQEVSIDDIKRGLLVKQHNNNAEIPDHFYKLYNKKAFDKITSVDEIFTKAIPEFSAEFLNINFKNQLIVKEEKFIEWQNIIADFSPLFLEASYLYKNFFFAGNPSIEEILSFYETYIHSNATYTALISPEIRPIQDLFADKGSFYDLHIHLNGVTESDAVWQNLLNEIDKNAKTINQKLKENDFLQQIEQTGIQISNNQISEMLREAQKIRWDFFDAVFKNQKKSKEININNAYYNPFALLFDGLPDSKLPNKQLGHEMLMYILVLKYLDKTGDIRIAGKLHKYLLIYGFFEELIVQDYNKFGFEQFQKMPNNDIRSTCDEYQLNKFLQLTGNHLDNMQFACFRFSPKDDTDKQMKMLKKIDDDWNIFKKNYLSVINGAESINKIDYRLIAHFIKKPENSKNHSIRFCDLRKDLNKRGHALESVLNGKSELSKRIVAIDAASSEFDTPPEVFAPLFKELRDKRLIHHITYHAGEDFYHILSGLRAIYEAIDFLNMKNGDRIGHATAAGTDIKIWSAILGSELCIPIGIYMDDLVFAYYFIGNEKIEQLYQKLPFLAQKIENLSLQIYEKSYPISLQVEAWKKRKYNPESICDKNKNTLAGNEYNNNFLEVPEQEFELLRRYNDINYRNNYDKPIWVEIEELFSIDELVLLQQALLKFMHEKEIVIEALPTSNLRIGYHRSLNSYQLFNWINWKKQGLPIPPIVLGSDDPGIFETNIYNEYALVYCYLVYEKKLPREETMKYIMDIYNDSRIYAFKK